MPVCCCGCVCVCVCGVTCGCAAAGLVGVVVSMRSIIGVEIYGSLVYTDVGVIFVVIPPAVKNMDIVDARYTRTRIYCTL